MTKAMPFLRKYDITFLRPPPFHGVFLVLESGNVLLSRAFPIALSSPGELA